MSDAKPVINLAVATTKPGGNGGKFEFKQCRIGPAIGLEKLGCSLYVVPPGKRAFPYHAHALMEEMYIILEGSGTLRQEGQEFPIQAGDVIASAIGKAHQIINTSGNDLKYLVISNNELTDIVLYPDSDKVGAISKAFGKTLWHFARKSAAVNYYDGEA
ncbi:MAG: cupin domain-containing protein [Xanthobacteraceae bacterium]|jgi:uncharacterized cupin superfamily protein